VFQQKELEQKELQPKELYQKDLEQKELEQKELELKELEQKELAPSFTLRKCRTKPVQFPCLIRTYEAVLKPEVI
jgi:hypothetical protein